MKDYRYNTLGLNTAWQGAHAISPTAPPSQPERWASELASGQSPTPKPQKTFDLTGEAKDAAAAREATAQREITDTIV